MPFNEFKCPACGLYFQTDLDPDEVQCCPLCSYHRPEAIKVVENKSLCAECAGLKQPMSDDELEIGIDGALNKAGI
jgi:hypothetical protein